MQKVSIKEQVHAQKTAHSIYENVNVISLPFVPYFLQFFSISSGTYEGIPLLPSLFSNAKDQERVWFMVALVSATVGIFVVTLAPLSLLAYGRKIEEIVFLNLPPGDATHFIKLTFALIMIFNSAINVLPIVDVCLAVRHHFEQDAASGSRAYQAFKKAYLAVASNGVALRMAIMAIIYFLLHFLPSISFAQNLNSVICANILQLILPNLMLVLVAYEINDREANRGDMEFASNVSHTALQTIKARPIWPSLLLVGLGIGSMLLGLLTAF